MKKLLVFSFATLLFTTVAIAQTERTNVSAPKTERLSKKQNKMRMAKELGLSKEQIGKMKENHKAMKAKQDALKANDQITVKEMKERKAALKSEQEANMDKILTPEQKAKFAEMKKNNKGHGKHGKKKDENAQMKATL